MGDYQKYMEIALTEAKISLREGNKGFGAVIIKDDKVIGKGHDTEVTENDPIAHAEINVIRKVIRTIKSRNLTGYTLLSTHEPCPMCSSACIWAGVSKIVFGAFIEDTVKIGRKRIVITCHELIEKSLANIEIVGGVLREKCVELYK